MAKERIDTYEEAARVIALWLDEFCDRTLRYPEMIADAARKAAKEIELLRQDSVWDVGIPFDEPDLGDAMEMCDCSPDQGGPCVFCMERKHKL